MISRSDNPRTKVRGDPLEKLPSFRGACFRAQSRLEGGSHSLAIPVKPGQGSEEAGSGQVNPEMRGCGVFYVVGLIQDQMPVRRKHRRRPPLPGRLPKRQVAEKEGVIHHQELGAMGIPSGPVVMTLLEMGATRLEADVPIRSYLFPYLFGRQDGEIGEGALPRALCPGLEAGQLLRPILIE
jgi:hypothetical protein